MGGWGGATTNLLLLAAVFLECLAAAAGLRLHLPSRPQCRAELISVQILEDCEDRGTVGTCGDLEGS